MPYAFRHQPLKGLYLVYQLLSTLFVRFPLWVLFSIPRSLRGRKSWTFKRALWVRFLRHFMSISDYTGPILRLPNHSAIVAGPGVNGVWVGTSNHLVTGDLKIWAKVANVSSIRVPGYWMHKKGISIKVASAPQPGEKVVYQLHGGGYVRLSAHPKDVTSNISKGYLKNLDVIKRVFSIEYRLASTKPFEIAHPFPTQLLDALAGYNYLVNVVGFAPENIIVSGDSAGGNLAHALTRYLTEYQDSTEVHLPPPPGALILLSPWVDLGTTTSRLRNSSAKTFVTSDYIGSNDGSRYAEQAFCGPHGLGAAFTNAYISPASLHSGLTVDFKKFPRTFIVAGGAEVLYDSIKILRDRMISDMGEGNGIEPNDGRVRYLEAPDGIHDYLVFPWHEPERTDTYKAINEWLIAAS